MSVARPIEELLDEQTSHLRTDAEAELASFYRVTTPEQYYRFLGRSYGFIAPLERSLLDTADIELVLDTRRFGKHRMLEQDLQTAGMKLIEIQSLPQCMWIPWFDDVHTALGWAYVAERSVQTLPSLYRHLASTLPGQAAFGATFLKYYAAGSGAMWSSFVQSVARASSEPEHVEAVIAGAKVGYRFFRRWRSTLDGAALSMNLEAVDDSPEPAVRESQTGARERRPSSAPPEDS